MHSTTRLPRIVRSNLTNLAWVLAAFVMVLMAAAAIASLVTGVATPDVIGADGLGSITMAP